MIVGIDISNWQNAVDFNAVKASGREFVIIKATEGTSYVDPWWQRHVDGARAAGLVVFHYHFARPDLGNAASAEADFFANTINLPNGEGAMLDMESGSGSLSGWLMTCADRIQARTQAPLTIIYTGNWYIAGRLTDARLATYRLCDAVYNPGTQFPSPPPPWTTGPDFWQHTDKATVPGVTGACDEDYFAGTMDELRAMCKGGPAVAPPATGEDDLTPDQLLNLKRLPVWMERLHHENWPSDPNAQENDIDVFARQIPDDLQFEGVITAIHQTFEKNHQPSQMEILQAIKAKVGA